MQLVVRKPAIELLIDHGYNPDFGARPLRRAVERYLEDPLSEQILTGKFKSGRIVVDRLDDELAFEREEIDSEAEEEEESPEAAKEPSHAQP
jgi:ATP-dependent Clp protease ATP-binding subunit ClpC